MRLQILFAFSFLFLTSCKENKSTSKSLIPKVVSSLNIKYAKGFSITHYESHTEILVTSPWPKSQDTYKYILVNKNQQIPEHKDTNISSVVRAKSKSMTFAEKIYTKKGKQNLCDIYEVCLKNKAIERLL